MKEAADICVREGTACVCGWWHLTQHERHSERSMEKERQRTRERERERERTREREGGGEMGGANEYLRNR